MVILSLGITWKHVGHDNLTQIERQALKELKGAKNVIIKRSDKGGNVILMDDSVYEKEAKRLLGDTNTYRRLDGNPFPKLVQNLNSKLDDAMEGGLLTKRECEYLSVEDYNIPTFYCIPKVHKSLEKPPGRPIVSAIRGPLDRMGKYMDSLLKGMVVELKSYVQDTRHVLARLANLEVREEAWLVSIDVESLYTSIPHEQGITAVRNSLEKNFPLLGSQNEFGGTP